ncbi:MAG: hypothetical protein M9916_09210 [Crocinitomicaceae bacterium]|nr:hypothetical protein [Crocinitomicaceae bacterium]
MKHLVVFLGLSLLVLSCGGNKNELAFDKRIEAYEDSIEQWGGGLGSKEEINGFAERYISLLLETYEEEPKNPKNPQYLDRVHMWYATIGKPVESIKWATILLDKYPKYENREMVLESVAAIYDGDITPRDSNKVRQYYLQLLKEFPTMDKEKKEGIEQRLKYNQLSFEEYLMKQISEGEIQP